MRTGAGRGLREEVGAEEVGAEGARGVALGGARERGAGPTCGQWPAGPNANLY